MWSKKEEREGKKIITGRSANMGQKNNRGHLRREMMVARQLVGGREEKCAGQCS